MPRLCAFFNTCPYRASVPPPRARLASPVPAGWLGPVEASGGVAPAPRLPVSSPVLSTSASGRGEAKGFPPVPRQCPLMGRPSSLVLETRP